MTLEVHAGLFADDLDEVGECLDQAFQSACADHWPNEGRRLV